MERTVHLDVLDREITALRHLRDSGALKEAAIAVRSSELGISGADDPGAEAEMAPVLDEITNQLKSNLNRVISILESTCHEFRRVHED